MQFAKFAAAALFALNLFAVSCASAAEPLAPGKGDFAYVDQGIGNDKPIKVWYYKPSGLDSNAKLMFVMHGVDRNGEKYRDSWILHADKHRFLVVVPEFQERYFRTKEYQFGNVADTHRERWSFQAIEHLFDDIRARESLVTETYMLFGHSAGAQFVHRMMIFMPSVRAEIAFACNAGSYTMPIYPGLFDAPFPMSLDRRLVDETSLAQVFSRRLVVMLGEDDTDESGPHVPKSASAVAEGANRFERGQKFFATAQAKSSAMNVPLKWELVTVPGVGHSGGRMAAAAVKYLFSFP